MNRRLSYPDEPADPASFTAKQDALYSRYAAIYDILVKSLPIWKRWLRATIPHLQGPRVLEVSFGTGYLMTQYAHKFETHGIDYNLKLVKITKHNLRRKGIATSLQQADVEWLPYPDGCFDTVVNTMAMSAYPNGSRALSEMKRVLRDGGKLVVIDVNYPGKYSPLGMLAANGWLSAGDILRDMHALFKSCNLTYSDEEIGGFGTVHLYIGLKT